MSEMKEGTKSNHGVVVKHESLASGLFRMFAKKAAELSGTARVFILAVTVIVVWLVTGPMFGFSDTWQLVINTGTTVVTFLMVFLIQNTQNRDSKAVHLKLDEIIVAIKKARNKFVDVEDWSDNELEALRHEFDGVLRMRKREK